MILQWAASDAELLLQLAHDTDAFNRWEAAQRLMLDRLLQAIRNGGTLQLDAALTDALRAILAQPSLDAAFKDLVLTMPSEGYVAERLAAQGTPVDPQLIHQVRENARLQLAQALRGEWETLWAAHAQTGAYTPDAQSAGRRALANLALSQLVLDATQRGDSVWPGRALQRFKDAGNMTDRLGALAALVHAHAGLAEPALARFHDLFRDEALVIDKWFQLQAGAPEHEGRVFQRIKALAQHADFSLKNPNRARSLLMVLTQNPSVFHRADAAGYVFWSEKVLEIDAINPQLAARLARALDRWRVLAEPYRSAANEALKRIAAKPDLSPDTREIVGRALAE